MALAKDRNREIPAPGTETPPKDISTIEADNLAYEQSPERKDDILHAERESELQAAKESYASPHTEESEPVHPPVVSKDNVIIEVEQILEDGLGQYYASLPEQAKPVFKKKGEEVAREISTMVRTFKVKFKRLVTIISNWLRTIPGVNKYFLEQEAKIKADRIIELVETRKSDQL